MVLKKLKSSISGLFKKKSEVTRLKTGRESSDDLLRCPICLSSYTRAQDPFVGHCGHTLCRACVRSLRTCDCPICRKADAFISPSKNYLASEFLCQMGDFNSNGESEPDYDPVVPQGNSGGTRNPIEETISAILDRYSDMDNELIRLKQEVLQTIRQIKSGTWRPDPNDTVPCYDLIWHMIMAWSLKGSNPEVVRGLQEIISSTSPHYRALKTVTSAILRWGYCQRTGTTRPDEDELKKWENWPEEPETREEEVSDGVRHRLQLLLLIGTAFYTDYLLRYELEIPNGAGFISDLLHIVQLFDYGTYSTATEDSYSP